MLQHNTLQCFIAVFTNSTTALTKWIFVNLFIFPGRQKSFQGQRYSLDPKGGGKTRYLACSQPSIFLPFVPQKIKYYLEYRRMFNTGPCKVFYFFPLHDYLMGINSNVFDGCPLIFFILVKYIGSCVFNLYNVFML